MTAESEPKNNYTPEQQAGLEKQRTISDAELLTKGAEYELDENGNKTLLVKEGQAHELREEKEGMADTVGTYIRMHKRIVVPNEGDELTPRDQIVGWYDEAPLADILKGEKGAIWEMGRSGPRGSQEYYFIDKDGDIAAFYLDAENVKSLQPARNLQVKEHVNEVVKAELAALGFKFIDGYDDKDGLIHSVRNIVKAREEAAKKKEQESKGEEFSF